MKRITNMKDEIYAESFEQEIFRDSYTIVPLLMRPKSRGEILLNSKNPQDSPRIFPKYFDDPQDLKVGCFCL